MTLNNFACRRRPREAGNHSGLASPASPVLRTSAIGIYPAAPRLRLERKKGHYQASLVDGRCVTWTGTEDRHHHAFKQRPLDTPTYLLRQQTWRFTVQTIRYAQTGIHGLTPSGVGGHAAVGWTRT